MKRGYSIKVMRYHEYITGDYSLVTNQEYNKKKAKQDIEINSVPKRHKRLGTLNIILLTIFITFGVLAYMGNRDESKNIQDKGSVNKSVSNTTVSDTTVTKTKATPAVKEQLTMMQDYMSNVENILGKGYSKSSGDNDSRGGMYSYFFLDYNTKASISEVTINCSYDYDNMSSISTNMSMTIVELKVGQGIKLGDEVKGIITKFSPNIDYTKVIKEEDSLSKSLAEGKTVNSKLSFGDTYITITEEIIDEHVHIVFYADNNIKLN